MDTHEPKEEVKNLETPQTALMACTTKKGTKTVCLGYDLGYRFIATTWRDIEIAEIIGLNPRQYNDLKTKLIDKLTEHGTQRLIFVI